ncbi:ABC transporter permease [[Acholeplasma] multilocale]|nr:ABC transporter permease [[Acholeplasma] multilocale]
MTTKTNLIENKKVHKARIGMPIFNHAIKKISKSKTFIVMTSIFFFAFIAINISYSFIFNQGEPTFMKMVFTSIAIIGVYITYFEIHCCSALFTSEMKAGIMNLEIRSGISKARIFWERILVNKLMSTVAILAFILLYVVILSISPNKLIVFNLGHYTVNLLFLFVFDLLLVGVLLLFSSGNSSILMGVFGTLMAVLMLITPLVGMIISLGSNKDVSVMNAKYRVAKRTNDLAEKNTEIEELIEAYSKMSIDGSKVRILDEYKNVISNSVIIDEIEVQQYSYDSSYPQFESYTNDNEGLNQYLFDLINEGLYLDASNLSVRLLTDERERIKGYLDFSQAFSNHDNKLAELFKSVHANEKASRATDWIDSYFTVNDYNSETSKVKMFSKQNSFKNLDDTFKVLKADTFSTIVDEVDTLNKTYFTDATINDWDTISIDQYKGRDRIFINSNSYYGLSLNDWTRETTLSVRERTFNKVLTTMLSNALVVENSVYRIEKNGEEAIVSADEYLDHVKNKNSWNPLYVLPNMMFNNSNDQDFGFKHYPSSGNVNDVYEVIGSHQNPNFKDIIVGGSISPVFTVDRDNVTSQIEDLLLDDFFGMYGLYANRIKNALSIGDSEYRDLFIDNLFNNIRFYESGSNGNSVMISLTPKGDLLNYVKWNDNDSVQIAISGANITILNENNEEETISIDELRRIVDSALYEIQSDYSMYAEIQKTVFDEYATRNYESIRYVGKTKNAAISNMVASILGLGLTGVSFAMFFKRIVR